MSAAPHVGAPCCSQCAAPATMLLRLVKNGDDMTPDWPSCREHLDAVRGFFRQKADEVETAQGGSLLAPLNRWSVCYRGAL